MTTSYKNSRDACKAAEGHATEMLETARRTEPRLVGSASRALKILELLIANPAHELGITQIAKQLSIGKSTAHQLVATLVAHGFVDQCADSTKYRLGVRLIEAGTVAATHIGLGPALMPLLEELVRNVRETCSIGIIAGRDILLVQRVEAASILRVDLKAGTRLPIHTSGIGRSILAAMPPSEREQILNSLGLNPQERADTELAINTTMLAGYSVVRNIPIDGISAIAVAIRDQNKRPVAGLVIAGPTFRFEPIDFAAVALSTAVSLSQRLSIHRS